MHNNRPQSALKRSITPENQRHYSINADNLGNSFTQGYSAPYQSTPKQKQASVSYAWPPKMYSSSSILQKTTTSVNATGQPNITIMSRSSPSPTKNLTGNLSPTKFSDMETSTLQRQRRELQLLMNELKDRDRELNEMVEAHQKQLISWETDRHRVLIVEKQLSRYKAELRKKQEQAKSLKERLKNVEEKETSKTKELEKTKAQLQQVAEQANIAAQQIHELKDSNESMASSIQELSTSCGRLQAKEQELSTSIKLKDNDIKEANSRLNELTKQFKNLQSSLQESRKAGNSLKAERDQWKEQYLATKHEVEKLRSDIDKQYNNADEHQAELSQIREELLASQKELFLAGEREKRKDQLIELSKSKQERTETELHNLRQLYERQQRDFVFLQQQIRGHDTDLSERMSDLNTEDDFSEPSTIDRFQENPINNALTHLDGFNVQVAGKNYELNGASNDYLANLYDTDHNIPSPSQNRRLTPQTGLNLSSPNAIANNDHSASTTGSYTDFPSIKVENESSPTERLHKLLAESRQMVDSLDVDSPYSSVKTSPEIKDIRNRTTEESMGSTPKRPLPLIQMNSLEDEH